MPSPSPSLSPDPAQNLYTPKSVWMIPSLMGLKGWCHRWGAELLSSEDRWVDTNICLIPVITLLILLAVSWWCCCLLSQASKKSYLSSFLTQLQALPLYLSFSSLLFGITLNVWISKSSVYLAISSGVILITSISGSNVGLNLLTRRQLVRDQFLMGLAN